MSQVESLSDEKEEFKATCGRVSAPAEFCASDHSNKKCNHAQRN